MPDWKTVVEEHGPAVWRVLWKLLGNRTDVEDAFQESFVAAIGYARNATVENWEALLVQLATRRGMDRLRARYHRHKLIDRDASGDVTLETAVATTASPHETAVAVELSERLCIALTQIPERQAEVFALSAFEGWSNDEIGNHLNMTTNTVRVNAHRARERLREILEDE